MCVDRDQSGNRYMAAANDHRVLKTVSGPLRGAEGILEKRCSTHVLVLSVKVDALDAEPV